MSTATSNPITEKLRARGLTALWLDPASPLCEPLMAAGREFEASPYAQQSAVAAEFGQRHTGFKDFLVRFTDCNLIGPDHPLVVFGVQHDLLSIVEEYLGVPPLLQAADIWINLPCHGRQKQYSQHWHRDPESDTLLKAFLYLDEVDGDGSPFEYIVSSHVGDFDLCPPHVYLDGDSYGSIPQERCVRVLGKAGTFLLADTNGLHRVAGGMKRRLAATWTYTEASHEHRKLRLPEPPQWASSRQRAALGF